MNTVIQKRMDSRYSIYQQIRFLLVLILLVMLPIASVSAKAISFQQAVTLALCNNPVIKQYQQHVNAKEAEVRVQRSFALPQLTFQMSAQESNNPLNVFSYKLSQQQVSFADFGLNQYAGPESINVRPTALNAPGYYQNVDTGLVVNVPIFSGFASIARIQSAKDLLQASTENYYQARATLIYSVLQLYQAVLTTEKVDANLREAVAAAKRYLTMTKLLRRQAVVIEGDVIYAKLNLEAKQAARNIALLQRKKALAAFRIIIGQPNNNVYPGHFVVLSIPHFSKSVYERIAFSSNPKLLSIESQMSANHDNVKIARANYFPQVNLLFRHDWNDQNFALAHPSNTAMLTMNWDLISFGKRLNQTRQAVAKLNETSALLESTEDELQLNIEQSLQAIKIAEIQIRSNRKSIAELKEVIRSYRDRYGKGLLQLGQLLEVQNRLDDAKIQLVMAKYQLVLTQAQLLMTINKLHA